MAKDSVQDAVMEFSKLRGLLKLAAAGEEGSKARLPIVVGIDNDNEAVVMAARRGSPKKLRNDAIKAVQDAKLTGKMQADKAHLHAGYAYTAENEPEVLLIELMKKPPGENKLAMAVKKRVKPAGFQEVVFSVNEALENEEEGEETDAPPAPPPAPPAQDGGPVAALRKTLAELAPRITAAAGKDAGARDRLVKLAGEANAAIKANDAQAAATLVDRLAAAVAPPQAGPAPANDPQAEGAALIRKIPGAIAANPAASGSLKALAGAFVATTKGNDAGAVAKALEQLRAAVEPPRGPGDGAAPIEIWRDAKEKVDQGIGALQQAMRNWPEPALQQGLAELADKGLNGLTDKASVGMMVAMMEAGTPNGRPKALKAMETFRAFLQSPAARDVDENPFDVDVGLRKTFGAALDTITQRLGA